MRYRNTMVHRNKIRWWWMVNIMKCHGQGQNLKTIYNNSTLVVNERVVWKYRLICMSFFFFVFFFGMFIHYFVNVSAFSDGGFSLLLVFILLWFSCFSNYFSFFSFSVLFALSRSLSLSSCLPDMLFCNNLLWLSLVCRAYV